MKLNISNLIMGLMLIGMTASVSASTKESPAQIDGATTVDVTKAKSMFDKGTLFVDVRKDKDFNAGRIPGAEHIELKKVLSEATLGKVAKKGQAVVIYCNGPKCMRSSKASAKAVGWGFKNVYYFRGGFPAWKSAGYPVE